MSFFGLIDDFFMIVREDIIQWYQGGDKVWKWNIIWERWHLKKSYNVLTDEELEDLIVSEIYDRKYKEGNVELVDFDQFVKDREEKYGL